MRGLAGGSFARELSDEWGKDGNLVGPVVVVVSVAHYPYRVLREGVDRTELVRLVADSIEPGKFGTTSWKFQRSLSTPELPVRGTLYYIDER